MSEWFRSVSHSMDSAAYAVRVGRLHSFSDKHSILCSFNKKQWLLKYDIIEHGTSSSEFSSTDSSATWLNSRSNTTTWNLTK